MDKNVLAWTFSGWGIGVVMGTVMGILAVVGDGHGLRNAYPTPAITSDAALGLATLAADEHRARQAAEATLDETRQQAQEAITALLMELQQQKAPSIGGENDLRS